MIELAAKYGCSRKTLQRYRKAGVEIHDPLSVAEHLLTLQNPKLETITRIRRIVGKTT